MSKSSIGIPEGPANHHVREEGRHDSGRILNLLNRPSKSSNNSISSRVFTHTSNCKETIKIRIFYGVFSKLRFLLVMAKILGRIIFD